MTKTTRGSRERTLQTGGVMEDHFVFNKSMVSCKKYVGLASLPRQMYWSSVKKGFEFTLMVVGESGLGKSTLINSLFLVDLYKDRHIPSAAESVSQTVSITKSTVVIEEKGIKLRLTVVDTPGFGVAMDNRESWKQASEYMDKQFAAYQRDKNALKHKNFQDNRVHCCLYFISPFGHGLKPIDVECMRSLHDKVNIIPVVAKADSLTHAELKAKKARKNIPLALVGSNATMKCNGRSFRARVYPWGVVDVESPAISDFGLLRWMLVTSHMQDLKDVTHDTHYENYRVKVHHERQRHKLVKRPKLSSLSIGDQEDMDLSYARRDLPPTHRPEETCPAEEDDRVPETEPPEALAQPAETRHADEDRRLPAACNSAGFAAPGTAPPPQKPTRAAWADAEFQPLRLRRQMVSHGSLDSPLSPASRPRSPWTRFDPYDSPEDQDKEYVGFATLPNQVNRKTVKKGFTFTLMVAGESGLGKSTLINSLFLTDLYKDRKVPNAEERILQTVNIIRHTVGIEEKGVRLRLNIIDTPGFGDAVNNTESWKEVEDYVDRQFDQYFREESGLNRKNLQDNRVHCCLYFLSPFGHGLRPLDVECMRALHEKVNIVPVLAKADSLTPTEVHRKKLKIRQEIEQFGINIYQFPECDSDEDEEFKLQDQILKNSIPFAVIGSNLQVESEGRRFRGRLYPWGVIEVENPEHSDFLLLRNMLVRTHMQDLKDVTRENHYENYRAQCIQSMTRMVVHERRRRSIRQENGADSPLPLAVIDSEKERLILEKDEELRRMQEVLERIQEQMQQNRRDGF
ncbi:unnamed protein product [Merluccius merluccius]